MAEIETKRPIDDAGDEEHEAKRIKVEIKTESRASLERRKWQFAQKKVMTALLIAYNGQKYSALQRTPGGSRAEEDVLNALLKAGAIDDDIYAMPDKGRFQIACQVDPGASASMQIIFCQLVAEGDFIKNVNSHLPSNVRLFGYKSVTKKFVATKSCDVQFFTYLLPTFAFASLDDQKQEISNYRLSAMRLQEVNRILALFKGTRSFHNFSLQRHIDTSSTITEFEAMSPFVVDDNEFVCINIKGGNFIMGQICKMIGLAIAVLRGKLEESLISKAWDSQPLNLPSVPSFGLILDDLQWKQYNIFVHRNQIHEQLIWDNHKDELQKFRLELIYHKMLEKEKNEQCMLKWLSSLNDHSFDAQESVDLITNKENANDICAESNIQRQKKKMVAIMMAFCGQGYMGMQRNPGVKTIEDDFLYALVLSGLINEKEYETPQLVNFQRSCRTDKGVSAAMQIVSMKLGVDDNTLTKINSHLQPQIRVFGCMDVTKKFNCKIACNARTYSYMLPTFAFCSLKDQIESVESYRITEEVLNHVTEVLNKFQGTHRFHNFTAGRDAGDASCQRYIISFQKRSDWLVALESTSQSLHFYTVCCVYTEPKEMMTQPGEPFVRENMEFLIITVKGQSFMLHQIRKMMGLTIAIVKGFTTVDTIDKSWASERVDIPIAPSLGLVLEEVHYDSYNRRYGDDGIHKPINWDKYKVQLSKFKEDYIYPTIIAGEKNDKSMFNWLDTLKIHSYDARLPSDPLCSPINMISDKRQNEDQEMGANGDQEKDISD